MLLQEKGGVMRESEIGSMTFEHFMQRHVDSLIEWKRNCHERMEAAKDHLWNLWCCKCRPEHSSDMSEEKIKAVLTFLEDENSGCHECYTCRRLNEEHVAIGDYEASEYVYYSAEYYKTYIELKNLGVCGEHC
jgi:hypothetical protein